MFEFQFESHKILSFEFKFEFKLGKKFEFKFKFKFEFAALIEITTSWCKNEEVGNKEFCCFRAGLKDNEFG